jgi:ubiquitin-protein ligase
MTVRLRRLQGEFERVKAVFENHARIRVAECHGTPPDKYVIEYRVKGLVEEAGAICERDMHRAEISLGPGYPREMPRCIMLTPIFHPNIDHLAICTEDIGSVGQTIDQTIIFIGQMICFQAYNLQSPRNGDAAKWTKENGDRLPLETVDLASDVSGEASFCGRIALAADAAWHDVRDAVIQAGTAEAVQPTGTETTQPSSAAACINCGASNTSMCPNLHAICADCMTGCANCEAKLCLACPIHLCRRCSAVCCEDCVVRCGHCGGVNCLKHMNCCEEALRAVS